MESPTPNEKRVDVRKSRGDSDPDRIDVTGGYPTADDRNGHGSSNLDHINFTGSDPTADYRKCHVDSDPDRIGVTGGDPDCFDVTGGDLNLTDRSRWKKAIILFTMLKDKIAKKVILKHFDCGSSSSDRSLC